MTTTSPRLCDTNDMVDVHRMFRREFQLLPDIVRAVIAADTKRAVRIADRAEDITDASWPRRLTS